MDLVKAAVIKFVMTTAVLWLVLGAFYGAGFGRLLLLSLVITGAGFFLGDLFILPRFENWGATIADFILVFASVWLFSTYFAITSISVLSASTLTAIAISVCEVFFHKYMDSHILHSDAGAGQRKKLNSKERMQTEVGEEINPTDDKD